MGRKKIPISKETLEALYYDQALSLREIGDLLGHDEGWVARHMREHGLMPRRPWDHRRKYTIPPSVLDAWPSPELAYVVGLIASDGCLTSDNNQVRLTTTEVELAHIYLTCLGLKNVHLSEQKKIGFKDLLVVSLSDPAYRALLEKLGLTSQKSLRLGPLVIPDEVFRDFLRGVIDGDGTISTPHHPGGKDDLTIRVTIYSGSHPFVTWLLQRITTLTGLVGYIYSSKRAYMLNFNGRYALALLDFIYYAEDLPCLSRKRAVWETYRHES